MVLLALTACTGATIGITETPTTDVPTPTFPTLPTSGELTGLSVVPSAVVPTVFQVSWTAPGSGTSWVEYGLLDPSERSTPQVASAAATHAVRLVGLKAGRTYRWRAVTRLDSGTELESAVGDLTVPAPPSGLPVPTLVASEPDASVPGGFVATSLIDETGGWAVVLDGNGDLVWWYDTGHEGAFPPDLVPFVPETWTGQTMPITARIDPASGSLLVLFIDGTQTYDLTTLRRIPLDAMLATEVVTTRTTLGHHDFVYDSTTGTVAWLAYQTELVDGTVWASDAIVETDEGNLSNEAGHRAPWTWLDDFPEEPSLLDPELQAEFLFDIADVEWTHSNSLLFDRADGAYYVMSKFLDCLVKVDRASASVEWVMGGPSSSMTLPSGDPVWTALDDQALWSHAHMSDLWYDAATKTGGLTVFDNGYHYPGLATGETGWSRVAELRFDEVALTVEKVWEHVEPDGGFTPLMGDVRKLAGGTYLVGWSSLGRIEEIAPDGRVLWRVDTGPEAIPGRVSWYDEVQPGAP